MTDKGETRSGCREGRVSFIDISQIGNSQIQNTSARKHVSNILQYYNERLYLDTDGTTGLPFATQTGRRFGELKASMNCLLSQRAIRQFLCIEI